MLLVSGNVRFRGRAGLHEFEHEAVRIVHHNGARIIPRTLRIYGSRTGGRHCKYPVLNFIECLVDVPDLNRKTGYPRVVKMLREWLPFDP